MKVPNPPNLRCVLGKSGIVAESPLFPQQLRIMCKVGLYLLQKASQSSSMQRRFKKQMAL